MPFGLINAPTTFMCLMNTLFQKCIGNFVMVFMDDILVYSKLVTKHEEHLQHVLQIFRENKLYAKLSKFEFFLSQVEYLGFIIFRDGMLANLKIIQSMVD
jgi:hypothetical protein